ncbi:unnamed protein product, partial [Mycena citricolor]
VPSSAVRARTSNPKAPAPGPAGLICPRDDTAQHVPLLDGTMEAFPAIDLVTLKCMWKIAGTHLFALQGNTQELNRDQYYNRIQRAFYRPDLGSQSRGACHKSWGS